MFAEKWTRKYSLECTYPLLVPLFDGWHLNGPNKAKIFQCKNKFSNVFCSRVTCVRNKIKKKESAAVNRWKLICSSCQITGKWICFLWKSWTHQPLNQDLENGKFNTSSFLISFWYNFVKPSSSPQTIRPSFAWVKTFMERLSVFPSVSWLWVFVNLMY